MGWQPETQPKGKPPKIIYLCDRKKECNKHGACGQDCKHTTDIRHAVNFISLGDGNYVEERPTIEAIPISFIEEQVKQCNEVGFRRGEECYMALIEKWREKNGTETD